MTVPIQKMMKQTIWRAYCISNFAALLHPRLLSWFGDGTFGANVSPLFETSRMGNISNLLKQMVTRQTLKKTTFPVHYSDPVQYPHIIYWYVWNTYLQMPALCPEQQDGGIWHSSSSPLNVTFNRGGNSDSSSSSQLNVLHRPHWMSDE